MYMLTKFILSLKKEDMIGNTKWHKESASISILIFWVMLVF